MPTSSFLPSDLKTTQTLKTPGPGSYESQNQELKIKTLHRQPVYTIRRRLKVGSPHSTTNESWPSPAAYELTPRRLERTTKTCNPKYSLTSPLAASESKTREVPLSELTLQQKLLERHTNGVPGPGKYKEPWQDSTLGTRHGSPAYSLRLKPRVMSGENSSPGPIYYPKGEFKIGYNKKKGKSMSAKDLKIMARGYADPTSSVNYTPGPAAYGITRISSELRHERSPDYTFGAARHMPRDNPRAPKPNINPLGPGDYETSPDWGFPDTQQFIFTTRPASMLMPMVDTPGATLEMSQFPSHKEFHIQGNNDYAWRTAPANPGPGSYHWDRNIAKQLPRSPTFHMGLKSKDFVVPDYRQPGIKHTAYLAAKPNSPNAIMEGKAKTKVALPEPGPGHYVPRPNQFHSPKNFRLV